MSRNRGTCLFTLMALSALLGLACPPGSPPGSGPASTAPGGELGEVDFPASGAAVAQASFRRGVLLLHSFEYDDARDAFREAEQLDAGFVLAYWGEAMTHNHPLWRQQDREAALAALGRLAPTPEQRLAKAVNERERGYLAAVELLYGEGDKRERDAAYERAMGELAARYPDDLEAASFHALSILGTAEGERDFRIYMRAAAVAEEVFARNPRHPGAAHYLIHSYDDPIHAPLGVRAARVYAGIAPAASHAQHMISHIYVALGDWQASATANEKAFAVSEQRAERLGLPRASRNHHALHWLQYAYLQQGRFDDARRLLATMAEDAGEQPTGSNPWYLALMRAGQMVEAAPAGDLPAGPDVEQLDLAAAAAQLFAEGRAALLAGRVEEARAVLDGLRARLAAAEAAGADPDGSRGGDSANDLRGAATLGRELAALLRWHEGAAEEALALAAEATALEDAMALDFGPPAVVKPSHELAGELLLAAGRAQDASAEFAKALERAPRRARSLLGLARASAAAGDATAAARAYGELAAIWERADQDLAERAEVTGGAEGAAAP